MEFLNNLKINQEFIDNLKIYREYNEVISNYFFRMSHDIKNEHFKNLGTRVSECNRLWHINHYTDINIKELKKTHLCKNKFCFNCKKVTQAMRMAKYSDLIRNQPNIYHLVLTLPSVQGEDLQDTLKLMAKSFRRLYYILADKDKYKIPFSDIVVIGALRSLEITYNKNGFHPHYHVILVLDQEKDFEKKFVHKDYSYRYGKLSRVFSDFEIYIQKLWYCLVNNKRLTSENLNNNGYSCIMDKFAEDDFIEIFKYLCKEADFVDVINKDGEDGKVKFILPYKYFVTLYQATYRLKQIQGYGVFFRIKDDFDIEEMHEEYNTYVEYLSRLSTVESKYEFTSEVDYNNHIVNMRKKGFHDEDIAGFEKKFNFIDLNRSSYISFKKYVSFVQNLDKDIDNDPGDKNYID